MFDVQFITHFTASISYSDSARIALEGGCRWVQLRMKDASSEELKATAMQVQELCRQYGATFIIDDHVELVKQIGAVKAWVDYALANDAIILFDSAYECFITEPDLPRSIFAIEGAKKCAVEFCSLSKTAGFTGTRCGYTVVPKAITTKASNGTEMNLNKMWNRRQTTKFNGVPYIVQRAAATVFSVKGMEEAKAMIDVYRVNAKIIADTMDELGIKYFGGVNSPYIWLQCPDGMYSWDFFDKLLNEIQVVGTPGAGFGTNGDNYFRLTSFNNKANTEEAMRRFKKLFQK